MNVVGKYFNNLASGWNTPGFWSGELQDATYVPDANNQMSDQELQNNMQAITYRMEFFRAYPSRNSTERNNLNTVVNGYQSKLYGYQAIISDRQSQASTNNQNNSSSTATNNDGGQTPTTQPKSNNMLLWLGLAGVGYLAYTRMKKNKSN